MTEWAVIELNERWKAQAKSAHRLPDPLIEDLLPNDDDEADDGEKALGDYHAPVPPHIVPATYRQSAHLTRPTPPFIDGAPRGTGQPKKPKIVPLFPSQQP